jgi:NAD(P)H-dependent FMN reductase
MKVAVIVGSTRPGRVSDRLARWVANESNKIDGIKAEVIDLADFPLPFLDESISPQYNPSRKPNNIATKFLNKLENADAFVIITPEYNRSISGVLKNALDYVDFQLAKKPVALFAHGSTGGAQAIGNLRSIIPALQAVTLPNPVYFMGRAAEIIDEKGIMNKEVASLPYGPASSLDKVLQEILWYGQALANARSNDRNADIL